MHRRDFLRHLLNASACAALPTSLFMAQNAHAWRGVATEFTQYANFGILLKNYYQQVQTYVTQVQTLYNEIQQYMNMVKNTINLPNVVWDQVARPISQMMRSFNKTKNMVKDLFGQENALQSLYKGYDFFKLRNQSVYEYFSNYQNWNSSNTKLYQRVVDLLGEQAGNMDDEDDLIRGLIDANKQDNGQKQTMQLTNEFLGGVIHQMKELRKLMMGQIQLEAQHKAQIEQGQMAEMAKVQKMYTPYRATIGDEKDLFKDALDTMRYRK